MSTPTLTELLRNHEAVLLNQWLAEQKRTLHQANRIADADLRTQSEQFLGLLGEATALNAEDDIRSGTYDQVRRFLGQISGSRALLGFSPSETATFIFSLKQPLFQITREVLKDDVSAQIEQTLRISNLLDKLGLFTTESYQKTREEVIHRQQQEMLELSTPVVKLWDGILALPVIGTLDSARTQTIMESLLERIVETGSEIAIIDITGVPMVDTLTAQHLLKTVTAARLMGAECIISGIRPQIAQTIVHLGVELGDVVTKATLADAFRIALQKTGQQVTRPRPVERRYVS